VGRWSAGLAHTESSVHAAMLHMVRTARHYVYIENQFFISRVAASADAPDGHSGGGGGGTVKNGLAQCLYERIVRAHRARENFKCYVFLPLIPGYAGEYGKSSGVLLHTITHHNNASVNGLLRMLADAGIEPLNYIFFFSLRTWAPLNDSLVTELIYVHSKLMIVDDRACIIGSANINDRSLLGNRDSEVSDTAIS
jgi:phospholipase D1/2